MKTKFLWITLLIFLCLIIPTFIVFPNSHSIVEIIWLSTFIFTIGLIFGSFTVLILSRGKIQIPIMYHICSIAVVLLFFISHFIFTIPKIDKSEASFVILGYLLALIYGKRIAMKSKLQKSYSVVLEIKSMIEKRKNKEKLMQ